MWNLKSPNILVVYIVITQLLNVEGSPYHKIDPKFVKGESGFRMELLNYNCNQYEEFCSRIRYLIDKYDEGWDIKEQLIIDTNMCINHNKYHPHEDVETFNKNLPMVKIKGVLPFDFETAENRSDTINSLHPSEILHHCYLTEQYILQYKVVWYAWEQLSLDYSVCLGNDLYTRKNGSRINYITNNIRANTTENISYEGHDVLYLHQAYVSRNNVESFDDLQLNYFCNRIIFLTDNYKDSWDIYKQLEIDNLACWMISNMRTNYTRVSFNVTTSPPTIIVKAELLFEKESNSERISVLKSLSKKTLENHCNTTSLLLTRYNVLWKTIDQMSDDTNICNLQTINSDTSEIDYSLSEQLWTLPMKIYTSTLDDALFICKTVGLIVQDYWRQDPNNTLILKSLKTCLWKLTPSVLCEKSTLDLFLYDDGADDLKTETLSLTWDSFRNSTPDEILQVCLGQLTKTRHLYLKTLDEKALLNNLAICIHAFAKPAHSSKNVTSFPYYIAGNKIVPMNKDIPECKKSISTIYEILFPDNFLSDAYDSRVDNRTSAFESNFVKNWNNKKQDKFYFTSSCNNNDYNLYGLCSDLTYALTNSSIPQFCHEIKTSLNAPKGHVISGDERKIAILKIQTCLTMSLCPRLNCTNFAYAVERSSPAETCLELINDLLHTNWKKENMLSIDMALSDYTHCFQTSSSTGSASKNIKTPRLYGSTMHSDASLTTDPFIEADQPETETESPSTIVSNEDDESELKDTDEDDDSSGTVLAIITSSLAAVGIAAGAAAGAAAGGIAAFGGVLGGISGLDYRPNQPSRKKRKKQDSLESDSEEDKSVEDTTPSPIPTTDSPFSSTTESSSTTPEPAPVCWLEPSYQEIQNKSTNKRTRRSPEEDRILPESRYPRYPLGLCRLVINEFNSFHLETDSFEFIELIKLCKKGGRQEPIAKDKLGHYIVLVIDGSTKSIVFGAVLGNALSTKSGKHYFVTIGPTDSDGVTLSFDDSGVHYVEGLEGFLPNGKEAANMLLLLHIPNKLIHKKLLPSRTSEIKVDANIENILFTHKQDCLVYGSSAYKDKCSVFERICPELNHRSMEYILRDWEIKNDGTYEDFSLSRCVSHIFPMDVWGFKLSQVSPGRVNFCPSAVRYVLPDPIPHCSSTLPTRSVQALDAQTFKRGVKRKMDSTTRDCMVGDLSNSRLSSFLTKLDSFDTLIMKSKEKEALWYEAGCSNNVKLHLQLHMSDKINLDICEDKRIGWWIELKPDDEPSNYKFSCKICTQFYKDVTSRTPDILQMKKLMSPEGYLDTSDKATTRNTNVLYAHSKTLIHLDAVDYIRDKMLERKVEKIENVIRSNVPPRERLTRATENLFYQAMYTVLHGYPSTHFYDEIEFNKKIYHADFGQSYAYYDGFKRIVSSVARDYLNDLITEIKLANPFCLILDTYKDFSGRNMIAVTMNMFYKGKIENKFLCLLPLGSDHTAQAQHATILDFVSTAPGNIEEVFFSSLAYFGGDGASVNAGKWNSILTRMRDRTGRKIGWFHCSSHRLHLVFTQILKSARFLHASDVIRSVGDIYSFFDTRSNRLARLIEVQKNDKRVPLTPHKPHPIRWANSMRQGFLRIYAIYEPVVKVLKEYSVDMRVANAPTRKKAQKLLDIMLTKDYVTWLCFLTDIMDVFSAFSLYSQKKSGLLIDQLDLRKNLRREIEKLLTQPGESMKKLFEVATCSSHAGGKCTLENFEKYGVTFKGIQLDGIGSNLENTKLGVLRPAYIKMILEEIDKQFHDSYFMYSIMNPRNMIIPADVSNQFTEEQTREAPLTFDYGKREFMMIIDDLGKPDQGTLYNTWRNVIWNIVTDANFPALREMEPSAFWIAMLSRRLPWSDDLKWIVKATCIIPTSSAEVERLFSTVTYLLGRYRFRTSIQVLNDYVRLRSELPRPITDWEPYPHVLKFVERKNPLSTSVQTQTGVSSNYKDDIEALYEDEDTEIICDDPNDCFWK